jgi:hypothetical protein
MGTATAPEDRAHRPNNASRPIGHTCVEVLVNIWRAASKAAGRAEGAFE